MDLNKLYFCPRCHRKVELPEFLKKANVQGKVNLTCGNCKKGKVVIIPIKKEETVDTGVK